MSLTEAPQSSRMVVLREDFQNLLDALHSRQYDIIGPTSKDDVVIYDQISQVDDLPIGWIDRQNPGSYHLVRHKRKMLFGFVCGPYTWKKFLYPAEKLVLEIGRNGSKRNLKKLPEDIPRQALVGIRPCEMQALAIMDKVLTAGPYKDMSYARFRENMFIVAVNCTRAGNSCFCVSMKTGPRAENGYDLALTEVAGDDHHYFLVEIGSNAGQDLLKDIPHRKAKPVEIEAGDKAIENAATRMGRNLDTEGLMELLKRNFENPEWGNIGSRCLSCGNCTMVCPTCFCTTMEDRTDLSGNVVQRWRRWDSCHTVDFSYIHGGSIRSSSMARYRQWMMHKLCYWPEQFGTFGCVGCGRCIVWCPVGIDITEEAQAIRKSE